ncbi:MAG: dihydrofolate reductase [Candidatus Saccharibacteria bacterium]|nr:dihydrofolate reductase [Candidatus Saccharibacteria bacterium]
MAISPNGLIARENGDEDWLLSENWDDFLIVAKQCGNIVMGRETYEIVTRMYKNYNFDSVDVDTKLIVTTNSKFQVPAGYKIVVSPEEARDFVKSKNFDNLLLLGGGKLNSSFMKKGLVDKIHLTINPYVLGKGRPFLWPENFEYELKLESCENTSKDRVSLKYEVIK